MLYFFYAIEAVKDITFLSHWGQKKICCDVLACLCLSSFFSLFKNFFLLWNVVFYMYVHVYKWLFHVDVKVEGVFDILEAKPMLTICTCIYVCIYMYIHVRIWLCVVIHTYMYIHVRTCMFMHSMSYFSVSFVHCI